MGCVEGIWSEGVCVVYLVGLMSILCLERGGGSVICIWDSGRVLLHSRGGYSRRRMVHEWLWIFNQND